MSALTAEAHAYRLLQAAALLKLFKQERGHDARTIEELEEWARVTNTTLPGPLNPSSVLTREEVRAALNEGV